MALATTTAATPAAANGLQQQQHGQHSHILFIYYLGRWQLHFSHCQLLLH